jgi:hypothetical protein
MPCFFSGIFLVQALERNTLSCMIMDAHGQRRQLALTHFANSEVPAFPHVFDRFALDNLYFITGLFAIGKDDDHEAYLNPMVPIPFKFVLYI